MSRLRNFWVGFGAVIVLAFGQNCTQSNVQFNDSAKMSSTESPGNGQGYSGKIYVHQLATGECADHSKVDSRIEVRREFAQLTRNNCSELEPWQWKQVSISYSPTDAGQLLYGGVVYEDIVRTGLSAPIYNNFSLALNINGPDLLIDNMIYADANKYGLSGNFVTLNDQTTPITQPTDANREAMLRTAIWGGSTGYQANIPVPNGSYDVFIFTWEETDQQPYTLFIEGQSFGSAITPPVGTWTELGPYRINVTDSVMTFDLDSLHFMMSGLRVIKVP